MIIMNRMTHLSFTPIDHLTNRGHSRVFFRESFTIVTNVSLKDKTIYRIVRGLTLRSRGRGDNGYGYHVR